MGKPNVCEECSRMDEDIAKGGYMIQWPFDDKLWLNVSITDYDQAISFPHCLTCILKAWMVYKEEADEEEEQAKLDAYLQ